MDTQTDAQIYLADQRGCSQLDTFRSFHSFNFGAYFDESRQPFGALRLVNDTMLKAERSVSMAVEHNTNVIIIPLVGGLEYSSPVGSGFLEAGQAGIFSLAAGMSYEVTNPYESELINFLEVWIAADSALFSATLRQANFDINDANKLLPVFNIDAGSAGFIGNYNGRQDDTYRLLSPDSSGAFIFILSGAFEVQNRLLHERDGLALTTIKDGTVEFEALSNGAILLVLEIPFKALRSEFT